MLLRMEDISLTDFAAHSGYLLLEAIALIELLHNIFNALQESLQPTQAWPQLDGALP